MKKSDKKHITGTILFYTITRRKIPNIFGKWNIEFNSNCWGYPVWCLTIGKWNNALSIPHMWWIEIVSTVKKWKHALSISSVGHWHSKFCVQYRNVNSLPWKKIDWVKFPICHSWQSHSWLMRNLYFTTSGFATTWWNIQSPFYPQLRIVSVLYIFIVQKAKDLWLLLCLVVYAHD